MKATRYYFKLHVEGQKIWIFFQIFVVLSEYMNFINTMQMRFIFGFLVLLMPTTDKKCLFAFLLWFNPRLETVQDFLIKLDMKRDAYLKMNFVIRILRCSRRLFIILVSLTRSIFSGKMLISNRCVSGLMPHLIKKSWTVSNPEVHGSNHGSSNH